MEMKPTKTNKPYWGWVTKLEELINLDSEGPNSEQTVWQIYCRRKQGQKKWYSSECLRNQLHQKTRSTGLLIHSYLTEPWEVFQVFQKRIFCDILTLYKQNMTPLCFWVIITVSILWHTFLYRTGWCLVLFPFSLCWKNISG